MTDDQQINIIKQIAQDNYISVSAFIRQSLSKSIDYYKNNQREKK